MNKYLYLIFFLFIAWFLSIYSIFKPGNIQYRNECRYESINPNYLNVPMKGDRSIFINIASYRDSLCLETVKSIFQKAQYPHKIFIGICQQNSIDDSDVVVESRKVLDKSLHSNIRIIRLSHTEAKGPTWARYLASRLWDGEDYYLQIDSHTRFVDNWDTLLLKMHSICPDVNHAILTYYPQDFEKMGKEVDTVPRLCRLNFDEDGVMSLGALEISKTKIPHTTGFIAGGFLFGKSSFLFDVPYDPYLDGLFHGEEILFSARLWTHGYNMYTPTENIAYHFYERKDHPKVWDNQDFYRNQNYTLQKVKSILNLYLEKKSERCDTGDNRIYDMGQKRTLQEYYSFIGLDSKTKKVEKDFCL